MDGVERAKLEAFDARYRGLRLERPDIVASIRRSIERQGVLHPLVVNREGSGQLVLLDGFKRARALKELGRDEAPVRVVQIDESAARAALLTYNAPHRGVLEIEEAWVVHALVRTCKLPQPRVGALLGRHKSWVSRRLGLAERLDASIQDDMRLGLVPATVAREVARLPRGNQPRVAEFVRQHELTSRQCAHLVSACLECADEKTLEAILEEPLRYLEPLPRAERPSPRRDPRLSAEGEAVRQRLVRMHRAAVSLGQILGEHPASSYRAEDRPILSALAAPLAKQSREVVEKLSAFCAAAGAADG